MTTSPICSNYSQKQKSKPKGIKWPYKVNTLNISHSSLKVMCPPRDLKFLGPVPDGS